MAEKKPLVSTNGVATEMASTDTVPAVNVPVPTGGSTDKVFYLNAQTVTANYTVPAGQNAMTAGPITIANGVEVTISDGSEWTIV